MLPYPPCRLDILKYPRRAHYSLMSSVVLDDPAVLMLYTPAGTEIYSDKYRTTRPLAHHIVHFFWPGRYCNAEIFWQPDWQFRGYYLNVAQPHEWVESVCTYVDLELDLSHFAGEPIRLLDQDEYEAMRKLYDLPAHLVEEVERAAREGHKWLEQDVFPFDGSLIEWRPGKALV